MEETCLQLLSRLLLEPMRLTEALLFRDLMCLFAEQFEKKYGKEIYNSSSIFLYVEMRRIIVNLNNIAIVHSNSLVLSETISFDVVYT